MPPRPREVAPLGEGQRRRPQNPARPVLVARRPPQDAAHAFGRIGERALEPAIERAPEELAGDVVGCDLEERVDARLDRTLAQQVAAERMDRADPRLLELRQRLVQTAAGLRRGLGRLPGALDLGAQPKLELAGRRLGERHRDDLVETRAPGHEHRDHAGDERASSCRCRRQPRRRASRRDRAQMRSRAGASASASPGVARVSTPAASAGRVLSSCSRQRPEPLEIAEPMRGLPPRPLLLVRTAHRVGSRSSCTRAGAGAAGRKPATSARSTMASDVAGGVAARRIERHDALLVAAGGGAVVEAAGLDAARGASARRRARRAPAAGSRRRRRRRRSPLAPCRSCGRSPAACRGRGARRGRSSRAACSAR